MKMLDILKSLVDAEKLGGWVRAGVAAAAPWLVIKVPFLATAFTPDVLNAFAVVASAVVVGIWSQYVKSKAV
jgi:hypothetical protein